MFVDMVHVSTQIFCDYYIFTQIDFPAIIQLY